MLKTLVRRGFNRLGYDVIRLGSSQRSYSVISESSQTYTPPAETQNDAPADMETELMRPVAEWLRSQNIETVLDVGAHMGETALAYHTYLPSARIYSFEPQRDCYETLLKHTQDIPQIQAFNFALSNESGTTTFYRSAFTPSSSLLVMAERHKQLFPFTAETQMEQVETRRLDDLSLELRRNVLVKMDVQGFEKQVLQGAKDTLQYVNMIIAEVAFQPLYEGQTQFEDLFAMLRPLDFRFLGFLGQVARDDATGLIIFANALFSR